MLQDGQNALNRGDLLVVNQDQWLGQDAFLRLGVGDEVWGDVSSVDLHSLDNLKLVVQGLSLSHGDGALLSHFFEGICHHLADASVAVGGDGGHLLNLCRLGDGLGDLLQFLQDELHGCVDATLQVHWVHASHDGLGAFTEDGPCQDRGGGGAISGHVVGLGGHLLDQSRTEVVLLVLELNGFGDCDTILGHLGCSKALLDDHIAALGAQGHGHGIGQAIGTLQHGSTSASSMTHILGGKVAQTQAANGRGVWPQSGQHRD
mmetsp:Transcript_10008/g.12452  ORF Transcript_10008/g.12452 Transcript_10008/m.12452 type:complete len:261 (+) Transcript_10008:1199-1981(+)